MELNTAKNPEETVTDFILHLEDVLFHLPHVSGQADGFVMEDFRGWKRFFFFKY